MRGMSSRLACAASVVLLCLVAAVSRPAARQQPPRFSSGVDLVAVDVTVLDASGAPITTLTADDFAVTVDGKPRTIATLRLLRSGAVAADAPRPNPQQAGAPASQAPALPSPGRLFVIVVDREHIPAGDGVGTIEAAVKFIDALQPEDRVAVWSIPTTSSRLALSPDFDAARRAIRAAQGTYRPSPSKYSIGRDEAVKATEGQKDVLSAIVGRECEATGENTPDLIVSCRQHVEAEVTITAEDARHRALVTLAAVQQLVLALASVEGSKHVVWLTEGPLYSRSEYPLVKGIQDAAAASRVTVHAIQLHSPGYQARTDRMRASPELPEQMTTAATVAASATGGLWVTPAAPAVGFSRLARELSASYLLGIEAGSGDRDGKPHEIDVRVKAAGWRGLVRARRSFMIDPKAPAAALLPAPAPPPQPPPAAAPEPDPVPANVAAIIDRLARYVQRFDREFSGFVAEERYVQVIKPWRGNPTGPDDEPTLAWQEGIPSQLAAGIVTRRQLLSDLLLVPVNGQPMAFRDVAAVDGRAVRDRTERVTRLFLSERADRVAQLRLISEESSRYNIGTLKRTVNVPTLVLTFMRQAEHHRFRFKMQKDEQVDGHPCRVIAYAEKESPTFIGSKNGRDIPVEGRVWLSVESGDVLRTELRFDVGGERRSVILVDFVQEARAAVLVPIQMWEWHEGVNLLGRTLGDKTLLEGLARYSSYRHFEVTTDTDIKK
jgi:VWFA-related protein